MKKLLRLLSLLGLSAGVALPARADFSFVHVTDTHVGATDKPDSNAAKDAALFREISALSPRPAFVMNTGDVCEIGTDAEYAIYRKTMGALTLPNYAAPGNHDVRWNPRGKEGYTLGTGQPLYQSWDYQNVHFVLLDSTVLLQHWGHCDQKMLDWLKRDLARVGRDKPVVIGFHHWIGRDTVQVDNEQALMDVTAPYNVRLWLLGHGHSDIQWNVNGAPAIMAKGLYQGSYHLIEVSRDRLRVLRRTERNGAPVRELFSVPLARQTAPVWAANAQTQGEQVLVTARRGNLPALTKLSYRVDAGKPQPMTASGEVWAATQPRAGLMAGEHLVTVQAQLADGRVYQIPSKLMIAASATSPSGTPASGGAPDALWQTNLNGEVQSKLVRAGDTLYVSSMRGELVALNPQSGAVRWRFPTGGAVFSTPLVADDAVYFGSADHFVYALDATTGKQKWKTKTGGAVFGGAAKSQGVICIASVDTKIYGLDAASGKILWTAQGEGMYQSQAATDGERFFVGGWDNYFRALDVRSGRELWKNKFGRAFYFAPAIGSPTAGQGRVFVTSNDGFLHAMDAASGKILWEVPGPAMGYSGPLLRDGRIYNASLTPEGRVFCFDAASGQKIWETPTGSVIYDSSSAWGQTADGGNIYVGCVDGTFSTIRARDGALQWQYRLGPGHVLASPATDEKSVYIGSLNGKVTALPLVAAPPSLRSANAAR